MRIKIVVVDLSKPFEAMTSNQMLEPLDIAIFTYRMHNWHNIPISDLTRIIYKSYVSSFYSEFTIVELMTILNSNRVLVECQLNKECLIELLQKNSVMFPTIHIIAATPALPDTPTAATTEKDWVIDKHNGLWFQKYLDSFKIKVDDVFRINENHFKLLCIKPLPKRQFKTPDDYVVLLKNIETSKKVKIPVSKFIDILKKENTTYVRSNYFEQMQEFARLYHIFHK